MQASRRMSEAQRSVLWREWRSGQPINAIAQRLGMSAPSVYGHLRRHGGIAPRVRVRQAGQLSLSEREEVSRGLACEHSIRCIARTLNRSPSTISREINRNGGRGKYRAIDADRAAWLRSSRPKPLRLSSNLPLKRLVQRKLFVNWSPQQIAGWLKATYPADEQMHVSHETIYQSLFIQSRGLFKQELTKHLRTQRKYRKAKNHQMAPRGPLLDVISIRERPAAVEDRAVPGHWEGDLIQGGSNSYIATVVERQTRFVVLVKVKSKETTEVVKSLSRQMKKLPSLLRQSLTWDRGAEMASHRQFTLATDMDVYFCDPSSPWQRGSNENTNGLLRQYFPKGECLSHYTQQQLNRVASQLNGRPRKTLEYRTPAEMLDQVLQ